MGDAGGVMRRAGLWLSLWAALSCSSEREAEEHLERERQQHLQPRDLRAEWAAEREKQRVFNDDGSLMPSDRVLLGITLPRGLVSVHESTGQWYFHSSASLEVLRAYFGPRLFTGQITQGGRGRVTYVNATPKDRKPDDPQYVMSVRIGPSPADPRRNEVHISEVPRNPVEFPSEEEVRAKLEARRKYAD